MLDKLKGHKIIKIQRIDFDKDYKFFSPNAIIFTLDNLHEKLIFSIVNDGKSVDIRMDSFEDIESNYGVEFNENTINELIESDELCLFLNKEIKQIKVAEYNSYEIIGTDFIISRGKYAVLELITQKNKLIFQNKNGGWYDIDDELAEIPNSENYKWT